MVRRARPCSVTLETPSIRLRADAHGALEPRPERDGGPEAGRCGNDVDVQGGRLEEFLRLLDPRPQQPLVRGRAGPLGEAAREGSPGHHGASGQRLHAERKVQVIFLGFRGHPEAIFKLEVFDGSAGDEVQAAFLHGGL